MPQDTTTTCRITIFILSTLLCLSLASVHSAEGIESDDVQTSPVLVPVMPVMPVVLVEADRITPTTGTTILDKEIIESLPTRNGNVNELIGVVPGVQYGEGAFDSYAAGEIAPPDVSISGSRFYDNNYTIDGIGNTSLLDPANKTPLGDYKLPGHPQMLFLSPKLLEQITVYTSNIPAEFGEFSGGQVDAETIEPASEFQGQIYYRTTNDSLTSFHIHPLKQEEFENSTSEKYQPGFNKHNFGIILNTPVTLDTGIILSYQSQISEIPLTHLGSTKNQKRQQENLFLKLTHQASSSTRFTLTGLYSPTTYDYFIPDFKDSDYSITSGGYLLSIAAEHDFHWGTFTSYAGLNTQKTQRNSQQNARLVWAQSPSIDWGSTSEGAKGDLETSQQDFHLNSELDFEPFSTARIEHRIKSGIKLVHSIQRYRRQEDSLYYRTSDDYGSIPFNCDPDDAACISNEQYLKTLYVYPSADVATRTTTFAAYLQDVMTFGRYEIFPGLRASYDNLTDNLNLAPRLSTSWDVFGDQKTVLFAGLNRYYSGTLQTHTLYAEAAREYWTRTTPDSDAWELQSVTHYYADSDIKTPYSDEKNIGMIQSVLGGQFKIQYIEKKSRDEFAKARLEDGSYVLNNNGRSDHQSVLISFQRTWKNHSFELNGNWQETSTSNSDYDTRVEDEDSGETIWYGNEEIYTYEIPRIDFNRPVVANLIYTYRSPQKRFSFTHVAKYRSPYERLWPARDEDNRIIRLPSILNPDQGSVLVYEKVKVQSSITSDWHFRWVPPSNLGQELAITLDILNVFNKQSKIGYQVGTSGYDFELGRQIWAGVEFNF